ncbi:MAG: hypothetical protein J7452_05905 [Thermoflexus sp.]|jgi:hypothetical protein|nr:hypothetical protein [Thermoflexus sp.]
MAIRYTVHARYKFDLLARHGFPIHEEQVVDALLGLDVAIPREDRLIAKKRIGERQVSRIIYGEEGEGLIVITFYPGRKERYEGAI